MASQDTEQDKVAAEQLLPRQGSPVKDAIRSLEAQLLASTGSNQEQLLASTDSSQTQLLASTGSSKDKDAIRSLEAQLLASTGPSKDTATTVESVQPTSIEVPFETVTITQQGDGTLNEEQQHVILHEGQHIQVGGEILQVNLQEQPITDQQQQQVQLQEQPQIQLQEQPQIQLQEQPQIRLQGQPQILVQHIPHNVETIQMSENTESVPADGGEEAVTMMDTQDNFEGAKPVFKCVAVSADGAPDWSKVMNLNKDILKEVLEKHGISMDTADWPMQTEEEHEAARKRKKKAKKEKKKKLKLEKTKKSKDGVQTYCEICCRQFENPASLKHHQKMHEEESEGPRKCSICSLVFQRKVGLRAHIRKSHPEEYIKDEDTKDEGDFNCEEEDCERTFTTKMGLSQHINQHHKGLGKKKSTLKKESGDLACDQCSKTFTLPHKLAQHMIMHTDERPFKCTQCNGTFKHHSSLRTHELIHSNKDACSCPVCGTMFKRAQYVRRHMIRVHDLLGVNYIPPAPVKRYPCEHCHRAYERRSELADHMNSHTGAKPHLCDICAKGFAHKRALDVHRKTHTGKGAFHCDVCGKVFGSKSRMREHRVIHTGEKPFICQQCGSRFAHRANLREHLKSVHKSGMEPVPRGRRKGQKNKPQTVMVEAKDTQEQPQETLQYEILTTRPHPQIEQAQQAHQAQTVIPIGIHHHQGQVMQEQPQQIMYQEIQLQPVVVPGNANVQQVQGGHIETRHDDLASVAQIVLQLHTEGTYTVQ